MKRYLIFAGATYYASGGWNDFEIDCDTEAECFAWRKADVGENGYGCDWWHVVDTQTGQIVHAEGYAQS